MSEEVVVLDGMLSRVRISGFKSIRECDVRLGRTNVLIGGNGAGKSNFVSAFGFLQDILAEDLQMSVARSGLSSLLYEGRKVTDEVALEFAFGRNAYGLRLVPTDDNSLIIGKEYIRDYGVEPPNERDVSRATRESRLYRGAENGVDYYALTVLQHGDWRVYHFHDTSRGSRIKQEHALTNGNTLASDASNLAAYLYMLRGTYPRSYRRIVGAVRLAAPFFSDFVLVPSAANNDRIVLKWRQAGSEDVFGPSQFSDGTLRFACLATLLLQPPNLMPSTIIIDEPELGLHPYAIRLLAEMIRSLPDGKQSIVSTQSVELLDEFDIDEVIVVDRGSWGSEFKRLDEDALREWVEDYSLGELWKMNLIGGRPS